MAHNLHNSQNIDQFMTKYLLKHQNEIEFNLNPTPQGVDKIPKQFS